MAILVEGYNSKIITKLVFSGKLNCQILLWLYPSTKMAITPMFFEQIEKFQCLKLSTTQGPAHGTLRRRVTCPETCLKVFQLLGKKSPKDDLSDLTDNEVFLYALLAF